MSFNAVLAGYADQLAWVPVTSSNVAAVAYQPDFRRLFVRYGGFGGKPESVYAYDDVPPETYSALLAAPSKGSYLAATVKKAAAYQRVR